MAIPALAQTSVAQPKPWEEVAAKADPTKLEGRFQLSLQGTGATRRVLGRFPGSIPMRPAQNDLKRPDAVGDALVGEFRIAPRDASGGEPVGRTRLLATGLTGTTPQVWLDANADGAFDASEEVTLVREPAKPEASGRSRWRGSAVVHSPIGDVGVTFTIHDSASPNAMMIDPSDATGKARVPAITYGGDWYREGTITLSRKSYSVVLFDEIAAGDFRGPLGGSDSGVRLYIDRNANGKFDRRGEQFDPWKAFAIDGRTYRVRELSANGESLSIERSDEKVEETPVAPDISPGKTAPEFAFLALDRRQYHFPQSYAGKVVILHFWSSNSATVRAETQAVRAALMKATWDYAAAIAVCLDQPTLAPGADVRKEQEKIVLTAQMGAKKGLSISWPVVCDTMGLRGDIATKFAPDVNGKIVVMDGDTRAIIAVADSFAPEDLATIVDTAVKAKKASKKK